MRHLALLDQHCSALSAKAVVCSSGRPCVLSVQLLSFAAKMRIIDKMFSFMKVFWAALKACAEAIFTAGLLCEAVQNVLCCFPGFLFAPGFSKMIRAVLILYHAGRYHVSFTTRSSTALEPHWKDRATELNIAPFVIKHN